MLRIISNLVCVDPDIRPAGFSLIGFVTKHPRDPGEQGTIGIPVLMSPVGLPALYAGGALRSLPPNFRDLVTFVSV